MTRSTIDVEGLPESLPRLRLKRREERRLHAGHVWIYSNEVDVAATPLTAFEPGAVAVVESQSGRALGTAYVNPHSLICARLISQRVGEVFDKSLLVHRLKIALSLRERLFREPYYRLAYGEADALPGLVVDRYGSLAVVQISTAGMEAVKADVITAVQQVLRPQTVVLRNDSAVRALEGLPSYVETVLGEAPETVMLTENGTQFEVPVMRGQKTGWFFDQRMNRLRMRDYVAGRRVLDLFSYVGAWGVQAAHAGAESVLCVDSSDTALSLLQASAARNGVDGTVHTQQADGFDCMRGLREDRQRFDVVMVDPPAFIKRKKDIKEGMLAYRRLNQSAMQLLAKDGILITSSCSYHLGRDDFRQLLLKSARHLDRRLEIIEQGHQGPDHPIHPAIPETDYLKTFILRVLPN